MGNVNLESLRKEHGDKAESVFREIAKTGGYGDIPSDYQGGLDIAGVLADSNESLSSAEKDKIAKLSGFDRAKATELIDAKIGSKGTPTKSK